MAEAYSLLPPMAPHQEAFILDHGKEEDGVQKYADGYTSYGWNVFRFNKLHAGAYVLNRHPGKLTADRKFEIYGGGYVESVSEPDALGNVTAVISHAFRIVPPIKQGDEALEAMEWETKKKTPGSWGHFWNQYGMNTISMREFWTLVDGAECIPIGSNKGFELAAKGETTIAEKITPGEFMVTVEDGPAKAKRKPSQKRVGRHIDFEKVQANRNQVGILGEEIVMDLLINEAMECGTKEPVHVSKTEGDGLGYDIRTWDKEGKEVHIEVKATTTRYADGFEVSMNEVEASRDPNYKYHIFRIYNLDVKTRKCSLKIYNGPISEDFFKLVPTSYAVYQK